MQMQWLQIENLAGIKDIIGIERLLYHSHVFDLLLVPRIFEVRFLEQTYTMLC